MQVFGAAFASIACGTFVLVWATSQSMDVRQMAFISSYILADALPASSGIGVGMYCIIFGLLAIPIECVFSIIYDWIIGLLCCYVYYNKLFGSRMHNFYLRPSLRYKFGFVRPADGVETKALHLVPLRGIFLVLCSLPMFGAVPSMISGTFTAIAGMLNDVIYDADLLLFIYYN